MEPFVLNIKNGLNFRDLGGYKTKSGQVIKSRKIIRSARLSELSDDDLQYLTDYGLTTDIDFRSPEEQAAEPDRYPENTTYHFVPVFPTDETKSSEQADALQKVFHAIPTLALKIWSKLMPILSKCLPLKKLIGNSLTSF